MDVTNWQEWAVALVVGVCIGIVLYKMYLFFGNFKAKNNPCEHCTEDCALKKEKKNAKIVGDSRKSTTFASANPNKG
jgi:uncharacterized membrane-anchored protein YhcB (DUF1043 family)